MVGNSLKPIRFLALVATAVLMGFAAAPPAFSQAVAVGTVESDFGPWLAGPGELVLGGRALTAFSLSTHASPPPVGTEYLITDTDPSLDQEIATSIALTLGARNHPFPAGSDLAQASAAGRMDPIVQLLILTYSDGYDLSVATDDQRSLVAQLRTLVADSVASPDSDGAINPAVTVFAAAPDPTLTHLVVVVASGGPATTLIPAPTVTQTTLAATSTTASRLTPTASVPPTAPTSLRPTTTSEATTTSSTTAATKESSTTDPPTTTTPPTTGSDPGDDIASATDQIPSPSSPAAATSGAPDGAQVLGTSQDRVDPIARQTRSSSTLLLAGGLLALAAVGIGFFALARRPRPPV